MKYLNIVDGYGGGVFGPNDLITREQIAAMIVRMIDQAVTYEDINDYNDNYFADAYAISSWALPSVNFVYDHEIMYGIGNNRIDPKANTTCEQAILLIVRVYDKYTIDVGSIDAGTIDGDEYHINDELYYAEPDEQNIDSENGIMYVNNELIIHADTEKADRDDIEALIDKYDGEIVGEIALTGTYQVRFEDEYSYDELQNIIETFENKASILWCSTNNAFESDDDEFYPNDEKWQGQWETTKNYNNWGVVAIKAPYAWDYRNYMTPVNVGVFDSSFQNHEDIIYTNRYFNYPHNNDEHGTHVTGIIGAGFNNETGIAGIVPNANLYCFSNKDLHDLKHVMRYEMGLTILIALNRCNIINISQNTGRVQGFAASRGNDNALNYIKENADEIGQYLDLLINIGFKNFVLCVAAGNNNTLKYLDSQKF